MTRYNIDFVFRKAIRVLIITIQIFFVPTKVTRIRSLRSVMACGGWEGSVDSSQLEARLRAGLEADRRYTVENAAKLRAIHSAPTYEEFRQLVLGKAPLDVNNPPTTSEGLVQLWERLDLAERLELLRNLSPQATEKLAGGLVAGGLLGDAITTLLAFTPTVSDVVMVVNMLHALTLAKRFSLSVTLVCGEERWAWGRLLEKLQLALSERPQDLAEMNVTEWTLAQLKLKFNL
ncbi:hypothetical protein E2C01_035690 [Portunus trituberculatus]|uniref:Coiled-coil domain-containing protein 103 n=1 Tax=Portunus trituberculatus TaxID=210409 RepID=A0A5B7F9V0_PORTR|nr:hypothetical protein [Portunus trituberculatus]